jgi:acyl-CoA thioester hydrolase
LAENSRALSPSFGEVFKWPVRVYWEDTDAGGIVFYANYLKFFERSRTEWLRSMGIEQQRLREITGGMFVVIETSTHHHRPARLDDELIVTAALLEIGRASLIIGQQVLLKSEHDKAASASENACSNAALLCQGRIRIGWVDAASMRPARIPDSIVSRLRTPI